jgi:Domain of unknown function (DUF4349)
MSRPENENPRERHEKTARELRKHRPRPSESLISRVERLAERSTERRSRPTQIRFSRRKLVFALAAALSIAVVGGIVAGELRQSSNNTTSLKSAEKKAPTVLSGSSFGENPSKNAVTAYWQGVPGKPAAAQRLDGSTSGGTETNTHALPQFSPPHTAAGSVADITSGGRLADLRATLLLKVKDRDQLSKQTAKAIKIASSLSGYVVVAQEQAPSRGIATSYLELKVPAAHSQEALIKISSLGKILSQEISLEDLKATVNSQSKQILGLRREIASLKKALEDSSLTAQARSQLQTKLDQAKAKLGALRVTHQQTIRRGRLATITVNFTTGDLTAPAKPSRIHKALNRAWDGLSSEISWAAIGLIVASPFLLLAALGALLVRSRRRREEHRLLEK